MGASFLVGRVQFSVFSFQCSVLKLKTEQWTWGDTVAQAAVFANTNWRKKTAQRLSWIIQVVVCPFRHYQLGATAGLPSSAGNTVGQANRGTRKGGSRKPTNSSAALCHKA
jgi:hypothetical protein